MYSLDDEGDLVKNPVPESSWWLKLISRLHITYLAVDIRARLLYSRHDGWEHFRAALEQVAARKAQKARFHSLRANGLERSFVQGEQSEDLDHTMRVFRRLLDRWREEVESTGGKFYVVLLPTGREELFLPVLQNDFETISLYERFSDANENFDWTLVRFDNDGHWAEEGNRLAALHLYRFLGKELRLPSTGEDLEESLLNYYAAFPDGWMPARSEVSEPISVTQAAGIRRRFIELELDAAS